MEICQRGEGGRWEKENGVKEIEGESSQTTLSRTLWVTDIQY